MNLLLALVVLNIAIKAWKLQWHQYTFGVIYLKAGSPIGLRTVRENIAGFDEWSSGTNCVLGAIIQSDSLNLIPYECYIFSFPAVRVVCLICLGLFGLGCFAPRQGYRADPNKPPEIPEKHIPQRYKDRYEARMKVWELEEYFWTISDRFEKAYRKLDFASYKFITDPFLVNFLTVSFAKTSVCAAVYGMDFLIHISPPEREMTAYAEKIIDDCFQAPENSECQSQIFMHLHETDEMEYDTEMYYKVRTGYFPIGQKANVMRVLRIDQVHIGTSKDTGSSNAEQICNLFVRQKPLTHSAWVIDSEDEHISVQGDSVPIFGLEDDYPKSVYQLINFVLECRLTSSCIALRTVEVVGVKLPGIPEIAFRSSGIRTFYFADVSR